MRAVGKLKRRRATRELGKCEIRVGQEKRNKERVRLNTGRKRTGRQITNSHGWKPSIDTTIKHSGQRRMLNGPTVALMMRSNKRFKPGD